MPSLPYIDLPTLWSDIWLAKGVATPAQPPLQCLLDAYAEPQRHYHTLQHLQECLWWWQHCRHLMRSPDNVALALFYHDVVYHPKRHDNEVCSVQWMQQHLQDALNGQDLTQIANWILATADHQPNTDDDDLLWLLDIDLAILGAEADRFQEYQRQIRLEYRHVPLLLYRLNRRQLLKHFGNRTPLYRTAYFRQHLEAQAKRNLQAG